MTTMISLDEDMVARLEALSTHTGKDKDILLQSLLERAMEDLEDALQADKIWERVVSGEEKVYSAEETRAYLGLGD